MTTYQKEVTRILGTFSSDLLQILGRLPAHGIARGPLHFYCCKDYLLILVRTGLKIGDDEGHITIATDRKLCEVWEDIAPGTWTFTNPVNQITHIGHEFHLGEMFSLDDGCAVFLTWAGAPSSMAVPIFVQSILMDWSFAGTATETPIEKALKDVHAAVAGLHLASNSNARRLGQEFVTLLGEAKREEELHRFLTRHPEFICPHYDRCLSKPTLGGARTPDFAISYQHSSGTRWLFVEIEHASKPIFTRGLEPQFHSKFEQARKQIRDWQALIARNPAFFRDKFQELADPEFLLVYGRSMELDEVRRTHLRVEFSEKPTMSVCTYDDLAARYSKTMERLDLSEPQPIPKDQALAQAKAILARLGLRPLDLT